MKDKEEWRPVRCHEGKYEVSNLGRVRGLDRYVESTSRWGSPYLKFCKGKLLSTHVMPNGYSVVSLGKARQAYVHILVAEAFLDKLADKTEVHHINHIRSDNRADNLRWVNRLEQMDEHHNRLLSEVMKGRPSPKKGVPMSEEQKRKLSATRIAKGVSKGVNNPRATPVDQYSIEGEYIQSFDYIALANEYAGTSKVGSVCNGNRLQAGGFVWRFKGMPFNQYRTPKVKKGNN